MVINLAQKKLFEEFDFDKAKELTKERNIRLKRFMERQRTMGYS